MKYKFFLAAAVCTVMLTACASDAADEQEISAASHTSESTDESEISAAEETTSPETCETSLTVSEMSDADVRNVRMIETGYSATFVIMKNNYLICSENLSDDMMEYEYILRLFNAETGRIEKEIEMPEGFSISEIIADTDGLCRVVLENFNRNSDVGDETGFKYKVAVVNDDLTCEFVEYGPKSISTDHYGRKLATWEYNLIDADSGEVLISGYNAEKENAAWYETKWQEYEFPVDENRFVYRTGGNECLPGFGVYDFTTGEARIAENSKDLLPFGVYDGKIYSAMSAWDGFGKNIYVTDIETMETELYMNARHHFHEANDELWHFMQSDGDIYLIAEKHSDGIFSRELYKVNSNGSGIEKIYTYPDSTEGIYFNHSALSGDDIIYSEYSRNDTRGVHIYEIG